MGSTTIAVLERNARPGPREMVPHSASHRPCSVIRGRWLSRYSGRPRASVGHTARADGHDRRLGWCQTPCWRCENVAACFLRTRDHAGSLDRVRNSSVRCLCISVLICQCTWNTSLSLWSWDHKRLWTFPSWTWFDFLRRCLMLATTQLEVSTLWVMPRISPREHSNASSYQEIHRSVTWYGHFPDQDSEFWK